MMVGEEVASSQPSSLVLVILAATSKFCFSWSFFVRSFTTKGQIVLRGRKRHEKRADDFMSQLLIPPNNFLRTNCVSICSSSFSPCNILLPKVTSRSSFSPSLWLTLFVGQLHFFSPSRLYFVCRVNLENLWFWWRNSFLFFPDMKVLGGHNEDNIDKELKEDKSSVSSCEASFFHLMHLTSCISYSPLSRQLLVSFLGSGWLCHLESQE